MDGGVTVTLISVAMFLGCFFLGFTPLLFRLSEVSVFFFLNHQLGKRGNAYHALSMPRIYFLTQAASLTPLNGS